MGARSSLALLLLVLGAAALFLVLTHQEQPSVENRSGTRQVDQDRTDHEDPAPAADSAVPLEAERDQAAAAPKEAIDPVAPPELPAASRSLSGVVVAPDGFPVAGATVVAGSITTLEKVMQDLQEQQDPDKKLQDVPLATADEHGRFRFEAVETGPIQLTAGSESHAPSETAVLHIPEQGTLSGVELQLRSGCRVYGKVIRVDGSLARNRSVRLLQKLTMVSRNFETDDLGQFEQRHLNPGEWEIVTMPKTEEVKALGGSFVDHLTQKRFDLADGEDYYLELSAVPPATIALTGLVTWADEPISGTMQWFAECDDPLATQKFEKYGDDGRYEVHLGRPGPWFVVMHTAHGRSEYWLDVPKAESFEKDFAIPAGTISGTVIDEHDQPVGGVTVSLHLEQGREYRHPISLSSDQVLVKDDGWFSFGGLDAGLYTVSVEGAEPHALCAGSGLHLVDDDQLEIDLVMESGHRISGTIVDANGLPASGCSVWIYDEEGRPLNPISMTHSNATGQFSTSRLRPASYRLMAAAKTEAVLLDEMVILEDTDVSDVKLVLESCGKLVVQVDDGSGSPIPAQVQVRSLDGRIVSGLRRRRRLWTWLETPFDRNVDTLALLPAGRYRVLAFVQGVGEAEATTDVEAGETRELQLTVSGS